MARNAKVSNYNGKVEWRESARSVTITVRYKNGGKRPGQ